MKIWKKARKLNQLGVVSLHTIIPIALAVIAVGGVGAYVLNKSKADTASVCGAIYSSGYVYEHTDAGWRDTPNSSSTRNLAFALCKLQYMDVASAKSINTSGNWTTGLNSALKDFQLSKAQLKGDPDGYPGPLTVCLLGLTPQKFSNNSCASVTKPNLSAIADPVKPVVSLTSNAATATVGGTVTLTWKASGSKVACTSTIPGNASPALTGTYVYKLPDAKAHTFTLTCKNLAGATTSSVTVTGATATPTTPSNPTNPDTTPYTSVPTAPAASDPLYAYWKSWRSAVDSALAQKLTGQKLIDAVKPAKDAYEAAVKAQATTPVLSCKASFLPATLTASSLVQVSIQSSKSNAAKVLDNSYYAVLSENLNSTGVKEVQRYPLTPNVINNGNTQLQVFSRTPAYTFKSGSRVTLSTALKSADGKTTIPCETGYTTYDLSTGAKVATPANDVPKAPTTPPAPTNGGSGPVVVTKPPAPAKNAPKPKVADLGYEPSLHCVIKKDKTFKTAKCADANAIMLIVAGENKAPSKNLLRYNIDVVKTGDNFNAVNGCAARTINVNGANKTYDCTVLYTDKSFFSTVKQSVTNRFKSIVSSASADTFLNKSEAKAAIAKLKKVDALTKETKITLAYKGYEPQVKEGNLTFNYDESSAVQNIKEIQESDCAKAGGTFISLSEGCDLPVATSPVSSVSGANTKLSCQGPVPVGYTWSIDGGKCVVVKKSSAQAKVTTTEGAAQKAGRIECTSDGGTWSRSLRYPLGHCTYPPVKPTCAKEGYVLQKQKSGWTVRKDGVDVTSKVSLLYKGDRYTCYFSGIQDLGDVSYVTGKDYAKPILR